MISEGDTVLARWSASGTHRGELNGIAPTNKKITISGVSVVRFAGRKIAEGWVNWDALGLLQQLGAVPERGKTKRAGR
jgi:predicted ester cyclase